MTNVVRLPSVPALSWDDCRLLVESVVDYAIFMLDAKGFVATWNIGAERIKGYTASEIVGKHFSTFYAPEDLAAKKPELELERATRDGRVEDEGWRVRKDGTRFWASVIITALRDPSGTLRGFGKVTRDLSDRRRADEELRRSEERFRLLVENAGDYAIYMLDPDGQVATWNLGAERMKGYTAAEIVGRHFSVFFPAEDRAGGKPERELESARTRGRFEDEGWRVRKDGTRFWGNAILTALHDAQGNLVGFAKITRDLTTRREAEAKQRELLREQTAREVAERSELQLRDSEERFRQLSQRLEIVLDGVTDGITVEAPSGRVLFANGAAARMWGFPDGAAFSAAPPDTIARRFEILDETGAAVPAMAMPTRRVLEGRASSSAVLHVREREGEHNFWVRLQSGAVLDAAGKPELAVDIWHDVTAERRAHAAAKLLADAATALASSLVVDEALTKLARSLVPGLGEWCSVFLVEGERLRDLSVAHADPQKEAAARDFRARFPPDPASAGGMWEVVRTGDARVNNDMTEAALGRWIRGEEGLALLARLGTKATLVVPIRSAQTVLGVIALVTSRPGWRYDAEDVALMEEIGRRAGVALEHAQLFRAARHAAEDARAAAREAEEASRAKDEFLATVSHELRTPLSAILGWATLLKDRIVDSTMARPIEVIHRNAHAQVKLIDDILDVSRIITGKFRLDPKPTDLVTIVRDAVEVVRPSADAKRITIDFVPREDFCLLVADPERIQQVVWNLLSNAVKFTDAGGTIAVEVFQDGSQVVLAVKDTGRGIDPTFLPFVFERFKQADASITRRVGGLGLGLSLVRHIVELHGGRVAAASDGLGRGSAFRVTLPIRAVVPTPEAAPLERAARPDSAAPAATTPVALQGVRVLIVDDEPDARDLVAAVVGERGAEIETAASAEEGFAAFKRFRPDVLVSDIGMPVEDGFSFIRRIRALSTAEGGRIPALALTAFSRESDRTKAIGAGFTTHIGKPVDPDTLASAVANLVGIRQRD